MLGVTLAMFRRFVPGASKQDLRKILDEMLHNIYKFDCWGKVRGDTLAAGGDLAMFDYGINSGPSVVLKSLHAFLGGLSRPRNGQNASVRTASRLTRRSSTGRISRTVGSPG